MTGYAHNPKKAKNHNPESLDVMVGGLRFKVWGHVARSGYFIPDLIHALDLGEPVTEWDRSKVRVALRTAVSRVVGRTVTMLPESVIEWE